MTLSNTATPKYYGAFRDAVMRGEIPVCREVAAQMNLIDDLIADPKYYYDDKAIDGFVAFCEAEMTLVDGGKLELMDSFKLWAEDLLSWFYFVEQTVPEQTEDGEVIFVRKMVKYRLRNTQYLIVARGGAKTMYVLLLQAYFLTIDVTTTHQITTAPTMIQAEEVLAPFRTAITRAPGPLFKFLTMGSSPHNTRGSLATKTLLASTKKGIENFMTNSMLEVRPMSVMKLQGLRSKINSVDEWLSGEIREDVVGALQQGAEKIKDWIVVAISSEGTVRNGPGDNIKIELGTILRGDYYNPHYSIWHYKLDEIDEVSKPEMWMKAQPNLGITASWETYHRAVERAENAPASRNDILAKRFGIPMEGYTHYFTYDETIPHPTKSFWRLSCSMGADLSQGDDFCAFTFLFPLPDGTFGVKTRSYISSLTYRKLNAAVRMKYDEFKAEGTLHVLEGNVLDMMEVYEDIEKYIEDNEYEVTTFGYDPYNARSFVDRYEAENSPFGIEKVQQGSRTESVPLGDLKSLAEERMLLFDEELMKYAMGNAITMEDTNGNRKLLKKRHDHKIDNVAALVNAWVAYVRNPEMYE